MQVAAGRLDEAELLLARELELTALLLERHPRLAAARIERAEALQTAADVARADADPERTRTCLEQACALIDEVLAGGDDNGLIRRHWYVARNQLASELVLQGEAEQGLWLLEEDLEWIERMARADPADLQLARDRMTTLRRVGQACLAAGDAERAREAYALAGELALAAVAREPDNLDLVSNAFLARVGEGQVLVRLERGDAALGPLARAVEGSLQVLEAAPQDVDRRRTAWLVCLDAGAAAVQAGRAQGSPSDARLAALNQGVAHIALGLELIAPMGTARSLAPADRRALERLQDLALEAEQLRRLAAGESD